MFAWDSGVGDWIGKIVEASGLDLKVLFAGDKSPVQIDRRKVRRAPAPGFQWETEDSVKGGRVINCLVKYDQTLAFVQQDFIANEDGDEDDHKSGDGNVEGNGGDAPEEGAHESGDGGSNGSVEKSGGKANDSANDSSNGSSNDSSLFQSSNESGDESGNGSGSEGSDQRGDSGHESEGTEDSDESNNKNSETESEEADTHTKGARSNWHPCPYVS